MASQSLQLNETGFPRSLESGRGLLSPSLSPSSSLSGTSLPISSSNRGLTNQIVLSIRRVVSGLPVWAWFVPGLAVALLFLVSGPLLPWFVGKYAWTGKDCQEILGPSLLGAAVAVGSFQCLLRMSLCRIWLLCIPITLLCRELHFSGTGTGVYVALAAIVWYGVRNSVRLQPVWNCRNACGCLFSAACLYALAVSVDSGVWKFLPLSQWWGVNLEETLESIGHLTILGSTLCGVIIADRRD